MALASKGKEVALAALESATAKITLYGVFSPDFTEEQLTPLSYSLNAPAEVNGVWTATSSAPVTFEITAQLLDGESFTAQGIRLLDSNNNVLIQKALASNVTYNDPGEFVVESYTLTIPN